MRHKLNNEQLRKFGNFLGEVMFEQERCYLRFESDKLCFFDCGYEIVNGEIKSYYSDGLFMYYFEDIFLEYCLEQAEFYCNEIDNQHYFN